MYALVVTVELAPGRGDEAEKLLKNDVVPSAKANDGFVSGTWARSQDGTKGHSVELYETKEAAEAVLARAQQGPPPGAPVKVLYSEVYEVLAQA